MKNNCSVCGIETEELIPIHEVRLSLLGEAFLCLKCYPKWRDDDWDYMLRKIKDKLTGKKNGADVMKIAGSGHPERQ